MQIESSQLNHGRHRIGDCPTLELLVTCGSAARALRRRATAFGPWVQAAVDEVRPRLGASHALERLVWPELPSASDTEQFAHIHAHVALWLQRLGGHEATWCSVFGSDGDTQVRYAFQFDDHDVGLRASDLGLHLIAAFLQECADGSELQDVPVVPSGAALSAALADFLAFARSKALPRDARVLIEIARERDIPYMKGDRFPFRSLNKERMRVNGGLRLGWGRLQRVLDGTLCLNERGGWSPLVDDLEQVYRLLVDLGAPVPQRAQGADSIVSLTRARRRAQELGYPVVVRSRSPRLAPGRRRVGSDAELEAAVRAIQQHGPGIAVERPSAGVTYRLVVANGRLMAVFDVGPEGAPHAPVTLAPTGVHAGYTSLIERLGQRLDAGLFVLDVVTPELAAAPLDGAACVVNLTLAPELDRIVTDCDRHREILREFMAWLFPPPNTGRIPLVAITGTNGKTTTTRMIDAILRAAGHVTGMACSDGRYIAGEIVGQEESAGAHYHQMVLADRRISHAVLETARGSIADYGFAYDACDVAVCTNVTADHLGEYGIETIEDMARLKQTVLLRARHGAVLNADDAQAAAMSQGLPAQALCWVSTTKSLNEIRGAHAQGRDGAQRKTESFVVIEQIGHQDWIVSYAGPGLQRVPIIAVDDVPATFRGRARHNVSNAMQAVGASVLMNVPPVVTAEALRKFETRFENTPGRLNVVSEWPFTAVIDYAHNPDGYRVLMDFVDRWHVAGRKILMVGVPGRSSAQTAQDVARLVAGHFDHYVCRDSTKPIDFEPGGLPRLIAHELEATGVPSAAIEVVPEQGEAIAAALARARPGDLVVLCATRTFYDEARQQILRRCADARRAEADQQSGRPH
jgi:UDP-N-acetylmuramyl tripeptide synthase